jgi:hypothetical protein
MVIGFVNLWVTEIKSSPSSRLAHSCPQHPDIIISNKEEIKEKI